MPQCVFCKIVEGDHGAVIVYRNHNFVAFMDKHPANPGHVLVIPKKHYRTFMAMPEGEVGELYAVAAFLARAVSKAVRADGMNLGQSSGKAASQDVFHAHVHILPRFRGDAPDTRWPTRKSISAQELDRIGAAVRKQLNLMSKTT